MVPTDQYITHNLNFQSLHFQTFNISNFYFFFNFHIFFVLIFFSKIRMWRAKEGLPHNFFVRTTNDVTTHHYFFRPQIFLPGVASVLSNVFLMHYNIFFEFRQRHVIQYGLILYKPNMCVLPFFVRTSPFSVVFLFYS